MDTYISNNSYTLMNIDFIKMKYLIINYIFLYLSNGLNYHIYLNVCIYILICALCVGSFKKINISKKKKQTEEEGSTKYTQTNVNDVFLVGL